MDLNELEQIAMRGGPMPDGLNLTDQWFFQSIAILYEQYHAGFINREKGKKEKGQIVYQRDKEMRQRECDNKLMNHHAAQTKAIESAQNAYRKNRTLENADALSAALDGRL